MSIGVRSPPASPRARGVISRRQLAKRLLKQVYLVSKYEVDLTSIESVRILMTESEKSAVRALLATDERAAEAYEDRILASGEPIVVSPNMRFSFVEEPARAIDYWNNAERPGAWYTTNPIPVSLLRAIGDGKAVPLGPWED